MRGSDQRSGALFSYVDLEARVPSQHPLRVIKAIVDDCLVALDGAFEALYGTTGRSSMKSVRARNGSDDPPGPGRNGDVDFHGRTRKNDTHASTTDPDARLFRKGAGKEARLCFMGHALMENRSGLVVQARLTQASGTAERDAAIAMIDRHSPGSARRLTLGADKGYDAAGFARTLRRMVVTPHIARHDAITKTGRRRRSSIDGRTMRHPGYAASQRVPKRIEEAFGWVKMIAGLGKTKYRGIGRVGFQFTFAMAAYNLIRMPRLLGAAS